MPRAAVMSKKTDFGHKMCKYVNLLYHVSKYANLVASLRYVFRGGYMFD